MAYKRQTVAPSTTIPERIDLNRVHAFVAVAEAQSFTAAARKLGLPKSSASRAVSKLERELGITLLQRTTRKLALTSAGREYLTRAREALTLLSAGEASAREAVEAPSGTVRITAPGDPTGKLLARTLASFSAKYPAIRIEVVFTARRVDLLEEEIDLAVRAGRLDDASLAGRRITSTPHWLVAARSYLRAHGAPKRLDQLAQHECVLYRGVNGTQRWTLTGRRGPESVLVRGRFSVDDLPFTLHLARHGAGIVLIPTQLLSGSLESEGLERVLPQYEQEGSSMYVVYPADRKLPRRVALLRDHLVEELTRDAAKSPAAR